MRADDGSLKTTAMHPLAATSVINGPQLARVNKMLTQPPSSLMRQPTARARRGWNSSFAVAAMMEA